MRGPQALGLAMMGVVLEGRPEPAPTPHAVEPLGLIRARRPLLWAMSGPMLAAC